MCDIDVGRSILFGSEERREQMEKQKEGRERRELKYRDSGERNFRGKRGGIKYIYIYIFFFFFRTVLQYNSKFRIVL